MAEYIILVNNFGDDDMTDEQRQWMEEELETLAPESEWSVRGTRCGEAEGTYRRRPDGSHRPLTIEEDDVQDVVNMAFEVMIGRE